MVTDAGQEDKELGLISAISEFGWRNLLFSWDTLLFFITSIGLNIAVLLQWVVVPKQAHTSLVDSSIDVSIPMLGVALAALAVVVSLSSDLLICYLKGEGALGRVTFPFYWSALCWFVILVIGVGLKVVSWFMELSNTRFYPHLFVSYVSLIEYSLLSTLSVVESVWLFIKLRGQFAVSVVFGPPSKSNPRRKNHNVGTVRGEE